MNDCYYAKRDWRACSKEVCLFSQRLWGVFLYCFFAVRKATEQRSCGQRRVFSCPETLDTLDLRLRCLFLWCFWLLTVMLTAVLSTDAGLPGVLETPRQRPANRDSRCLGTLSLPLLPGYRSLFSFLSSLFSGCILSLFSCLLTACIIYQYQPPRILDHGISSFFSSSTSNANLNASQGGR